MADSPQALTGIRVLDLSQMVAGPYCTKLLADLGADVIKIEPPGQGDPARSLGPFPGDEPHLEKSGLFFYLNTNKRSVTLNLKSERGRALFLELAKTADIVIESFSPGTLARLGLGYEVLQETRPSLVLTSISNFGQDGPRRDYKVDSITLYALAGAMYVEGEPDREPLALANLVSLYAGGLFAAVGSMGALTHSRVSGQGQQLDISLMESLHCSLLFISVMNSYTGEIAKRTGNPLPGIFPCKDGYIGISLLTQPQWEMMCQFLGLDALLTDPRFATPLARRDNASTLRELVAEKVKDREKEELLHSGQAWRVPFGLVPTTEELMQFEQHRERGYFAQATHPLLGTLTIPGAPYKLSETPWQLRRAAPLLGEHTAEVLGTELGLKREELDRLRADGVI